MRIGKILPHLDAIVSAKRFPVGITRHDPIAHPVFIAVHHALVRSEGLDHLGGLPKPRRNRALRRIGPKVIRAVPPESFSHASLLFFWHNSRMKKIILLATFLSSLGFTSICFAEWTFVTHNSRGKNSFFVDFKNIQIKKRSVFFWLLINFPITPKSGYLSAKSFIEADCGIPRKIRGLSVSVYKRPMAQGEPSKSKNKPSEWNYPSPGYSMEIILNHVCTRAKKK